MLKISTSSPSSRGNLSESKVLTKFIEAGFVVSVPFGGCAPYDLIVGTGARLLKVHEDRALAKWLRHFPDAKIQWASKRAQI